MRVFGGFVLGLLLLLVLPDLASAQGATTGAIRGRVTYAGGEPAAAALVTVRNVETGAERRVQAGEEGVYSVGLLRPGSYIVTAEVPGTRPAEAGPITIPVGEVRVVTLTLQPVELAEIAVTAEAAAIDVQQSGVIERVGAVEIENLPTAGRDFTDFIQLSGLISPQPEISTGGQFSIAGARTTGTNVQVDGADANNSFFGENRGSSRIPFTFSLESIREFQIITNGYDVEHGKFSGGVINAVTRGGTNDFRGNIFVYGRDAALTAENFDDTEPRDFSSYQFGGVASGPIIRDKLHYFVSGDFQQRDQPVFALSPERSGIAAADIQEFLTILDDVYGLPTADQAGAFEETQDQTALFGRLDWSLNDRHRAILRANYTDFENENDRLSPIGNQARSMGGVFLDEAFSIVGELNSILNESGTASNVLRLHYSDEARPRPANSYLPSVTVDVEDGSLGYGGNFFGILFANNLEESKFQLTNNFTLQRGDHTFKIGTDNIFGHIYNKFWLNGNGFFTFDDLDAFRNGEPGFSLRFVPAQPGTRLPDPNPTAPVAEFDSREYAFYAQDEWRASDKLLLTVGVRYDLMTLPDEGQPLSNPEFQSILSEEFGVTPAAVPEDRNNFGPRVGFTYDLQGDESSVLRGGAGVFYGRVPAVLHGNILSSTPNPLLAVVCIGAATPEFNYGQWQDPDNIPTNCAPEFQSDTGFKIGFDPFGIGIVGAPEISTWDPDLEFPTTLKLNLGYEQRLGERLKAGVQGIFSQTSHYYTVKDLNIQDPVFFLASGRPVHTAELDSRGRVNFDPTDEADERGYGINSRVRRVYFQTDDAEARAFNLKFDLEGRLSDAFRLGASYTHTRAFDNSSFICCTSNAGLFDMPTWGNPNFIGDIGDEEQGAWGPSDFERRHVIVAHGIWSLPADAQLSFIYRAQSGNPFTPIIDGDVNADGNDGNDRPYLPDPNNPVGVAFETPEDLASYQRIVAAEECLSEFTGGITPRNRCRNPWFHGLDMKLTKGFDTVEGQKVELVLDIFNVLDGLGLDAGRLVFKRRDLFRAEDYDPETDQVVYSVNDNFGQELPFQGVQAQFQAQLGVRYHF